MEKNINKMSIASNKKRALLAIAILMIVGMILGIASCSTLFKSLNRAHATELDFEFYVTCNGKSQIDLSDFGDNLDEDGYLVVDFYGSALSASEFDVSVVGGALFYDKAYFSLDKDYIVLASKKIGPQYKDIWVVSLNKSDNLLDQDRLAFGIGDAGPPSIEKDTLIAQLYFQIIAPPPVDTQIYFTFDSSGFDYRWTELKDTTIPYTSYFAGSDAMGFCTDSSNVGIGKLYLGNVPGADPSADLSLLSIKDTTSGDMEYLNPVFDAETSNYATWQIPYAESINGMELSYSKVSTSAIVGVTFSEGSLASIDANNIIRGVANDEQIFVNITDDEGALTKTYTITAAVVPPSTDADLSSLSAKTGATAVLFEEAFDKDTLEYTLNIPYNKNEVTLIASKSSTTATMLIDGTVVNSKTFVGLPVGTTPKTIKVTAESGAVKNYTVNIVRAGASSNTELASITVNNNNVPLATGISNLNYTIPELTATYIFAIVGEEPSMQTISYQIGSSGYTIMPNGTNSGSPRAISKNQTVVVDIRVKAQDNTTKDYTLTLHRAPSTNTDLDSVSVKENSTTKTLTPSGTTYEYSIGAEGASNLLITATSKLGENATIRILDSSNNVVSDGTISIVGWTAGVYAYTIEVTPQDTTVSPKNYVLNIIKKSSDKFLNTPEITHTDNAGASIDGVTYQSATFTYKLTIDYALDGIIVENIRIVFTASEKSTIENGGWADLKTGTPQSGMPYSYVDVSFSGTTVQNLNRTLYVKAEDGSNQQYDIMFTRSAANTDNSLSTLTVGANPVDGFTPATLMYNTPIILSGTTESVNVFGTPNSSYSSVTYNGVSNGQIMLMRGVLTTVNINVTAQNGAVRTYTVKVIAANNDNSITNIELIKSDSTIISGLSFDAGNVGPYNISVPNSINVVTIKVTTPANAASTVSGGGTQTVYLNSNNFVVYATSEAGIKGLEYTIIITRNAARSEKILNSMTISSAGANPVPNYINNFNSSTTSYDIRVDRAVIALKIEATVPTGNGSSITSGLSNNFTWAGTSATIYIDVTAEDGTKQSYTVNLTRANDEFGIDDIEVDVQEITFNKLTSDYSLNAISYATSEMTFNVQLTDANYAKLYVKVNTGGIILQNNPNSFIVTLVTGTNTITLYAESDFGTKGTTYKFTINRNIANSNARLSSLEILAGSNDLLAGDNAFNPGTILYNVRANNNITSITINAETEYVNATYNISPSTRTLSNGVNNFSITVTAENGTTKLTYEVRVTRANDENEITNIQVADQTFTFTKSTLAYTLTTVSYAKNIINFNVSLLDSSAKVYAKINTGAYNQITNISSFDTSLVTGNNTISIYAESEFGTKGAAYVFTISRSAPSSNALLSSLEILAKGNDIITFDANTYFYELRVNNDVTSVTINATLSDPNAKFVITPTSRTIKSGSNTFHITITAEDNTTTQTYEVEIVQASDINAITNIVVDIETIEYDSLNLSYPLSAVSNGINQIIFNVTLEDATTKLFGKTNMGAFSQILSPSSFTNSLVVGENTISLYAVSEYGTQGETYVFTVTRNVAGTNAKLSSLEIMDGETNLLTGENSFSADKSLYEIRVDNAVLTIAINAITFDEKASMVITPSNYNLTKGLNTFVVTVTAENGTTKLTYEVRVTRANDENEITNIQVADQTFTFTKSTLAYTLTTVSYAKNIINFNVSLLDSSAKVYAKINTGAYNQITNISSFDTALVTGNNTISIYAESEFGTKGAAYVFTIARSAPSSNALLSSLEILAKGNDIITFDANTYSYDLRVDNDVASVIINATLSDPNAKFVITPTSRIIKSGSNIFYITTTAEDNTTTQTYEVDIVRASDINAITNIAVDLETIEYDSLNLSYPLSAVSNGINQIIFNVTLEDATTKLFGKTNMGAFSQILSPSSFTNSLVVGENTISLYAVSEYGTQGETYVFTVTRNVANINTKLSSLEVMDGGTDLLAGENSFSPDKSLYEIRVDNTVSTIAISAITLDEKASMAITPSNFNLSKGLNIYIITVTAEDGISKAVYEVRITKANDNNDITNIDVDVQEINYETTTTSYLLDAVAASIKTITFDVSLADDSAVVFMKHNTASAKSQASPDSITVTLVQGLNTIQIYAKSELGTEGTTYEFKITQNSASTDVTLSSFIAIAGGENLLVGDNAFDASVTDYNVRVDNNVSLVALTALASDENAVVTITPSGGSLSIGKNTIYVTVTAESGATRTYTLNIIRANDDNTILSIEVNGNIIQLNPDANTVINFPYSINSARIVATLNDSSATLYGTGTKTLADGTQYFEVYAISQYGLLTGVTQNDVAVYVLEINRTPVKTDNKLESLVIKDNLGEPIPFDNGATFEPLRYTYNITLEIDSTLRDIVINAVAAANNKVLSGDTGAQTLTIKGDGTINSQFVLTVTAQNGTSQNYTINITKGTNLSNDASIQSATLKDNSNIEYLDFDPNIAKQSDVDIPFSIAGLTLTVIPTNSNATVSGTNGYITVAPGGSTNVQFKVIAENGEESTYTYNFTINRAAVKTNNHLETLTVKDVNDNTVDFLNGIFSSGTNTYDIRVNDTVENIVVAASVPVDNGSTIITQLQETYALTSGNTRTITIIVQAENSNTNMYTLNIKRANNDNEIASFNLGSLNIPVAEFLLVGSSYEYTVTPNALNSTTSLDISAILKNGESSKATVTGEGVKSLSVGANNFTLFATAQDGTVGKNYVIRINRDSASSEAQLSSLNITTNTGAVLLDVTSNIQNSYNLFADRSTASVTIDYTKKHIGAMVLGDKGTVVINGGYTNVLKIYVTAEDGTTTKTYTINIEVKDSNNDITSIEADIATIVFDINTYTYDLGTVDYSKENIVFEVVLSSTYSSLFVNSDISNNVASIHKNLNVGLNTFIFYAKSERGVKGQEYSIIINKEAANDNNYLSSLIVKDNTNEILSFSEGAFNRALMNYTIILNIISTTTYIDISATAENGSVPSGLGINTLVEVASVISNTFPITVLAENGESRIYKITVVKSQTITKSNNNKITTVSLLGKGIEYLKDSFDSDVSMQLPITVPYNVESVYLSVKPEDNKALASGANLYNISEGETISLSFYVTAENGMRGTEYYVNVTRQVASSETKLINLYYEVDDIKTYLDTAEDVFNIIVDTSVTDISIGGTRPDGAIVTGLGTFLFNNTSTTKVISVTAQNGGTKTYVINVSKQNDDATIKSIKLDNNEILLSFINNQYQVSVPYSKDNVTIAAVANNENTIINGNGSYNLSVGQNQFIVYAVSQTLTKGEDYVIKITRQAANTNNNLASLSVLNNATSEALLLQPLFNSTTTKYTIDLTDFPLINEIQIKATAESTKVKSVQGKGVFTLKTLSGASSEVFSITVTAEDDSTKVYDVTIIRNVRPEDDITINKLSLIGSDSINYLGTSVDAVKRFELNTKVYTISIPFKVKNATLTVINNNGAAVYGNGNYVFTSSTVIEFYLDSQSGNCSSDRYVININKELPSTDNTLSSLTINGEAIPDFDPEINNYNITVSYETVTAIQIGAIANNEDATLLGDLGNINLVAGINTINVTVKAEDGSLRTYSITVQRLSEDNTLTSLGVNGYSIVPTFFVDTYSYSLEVDYTVEMVNVIGTANPKATIIGIGTQNLVLGANVIEVFVISEQEIAGESYTITINRRMPSDDNTLKSLEVLSGVDSEAIGFQPVFRPDIYEYIIQLETGSSINSLEVLAEANCPFAKGVGGTGFKVLKTTVDGLYNNVFEITVMAQNNTTKTYSISVYRDVVLADDISINNVSLMGSDGENYLGTEGAITRFLPSIYSYNIVVPYYVESMTLSLDSFTATINGTGQKMFGDNDRLTFTAYLVSQSGEITSNNYNIVVNRILPIVDSSLKNIKINGELISGFLPDKNVYEINIPYLTTERVIISAEPASPGAAIISGVGSFDLEEGRNVFSILVRAENGDTRSYNLVVNYMNTNSLLETLNLQGSFEDYINEDNAVAYPFTFIPDTMSYVVTVDKSVKKINLKGQAQDQDRAAIIGLGEYELTSDRTTVVINVIAADNTTTSSYRLNIVKTVMPSSNTRLKDLKVDGYNFLFDPTEMSYSLNVDGGIHDLNISAITEDPRATATVIGNNGIDNGKNVVLVRVEAEDGKVCYYQLAVNKNADADYFLTIMMILVFLLLLIIIFHKIFENNKEKFKKKDIAGFKMSKSDESIDLNKIGEEFKKWQT